MKLKNFMLLSVFSTIFMLTACGNKDIATNYENSKEINEFTEASSELTTENITAETSKKADIFADIGDIKENTQENDYGNNFVKLGNYIYFIDTNGNNDNNNSNYALYSLDNNNKTTKIYETNSSSLFVLNNYIYLNNTINNENKIIKLSSNGKAEILANGYILLISNNELYCQNSISNTNNNSSEIFKIDSNGNNKKTICIGKYKLLDKLNDTIYLDASLERSQNNAVLAQINSNGTNLKDIAILPMAINSSVYEETEQEYITDFRIADNSIILSAGNYKGSGHYFYGNLCSLNKGISIPNYMDFDFIDNFKIGNGLIYFNVTAGELDKYKIGCYCMSNDFSNIQYLGEDITKLLKIDNNKYLYFEKDISPNDYSKNICNLYQKNIKTNKEILLFEGKNAPFFDNSRNINYEINNIIDDWIYFSVVVHGYNDNKDLMWGHNCYSAYYKVKTDGSGLQLILENKLSDCSKQE